MHACLRLIIRAPTEREAVREAQATFDHTLQTYDRSPNGVDGPFDWATPMTADSMTSGANRWSKYKSEPLAFELGMERGQEELESAWTDTWEGMEENLKTIQNTIHEKSISELMDDLYIRRFMGELHPFRASPVYHLYDSTLDPEPLIAITNRGAFARLQDRIEDEDWIVPMDAHF